MEQHGKKFLNKRNKFHAKKLEYFVDKLQLTPKKALLKENIIIS